MGGGEVMNVLVKKINKNAVIPYKTHNNDFCYDVVATSCEEIAPNVYKYGIGLAFQIDRGLSPTLEGVVCIDKDIEKTSVFAARVVLDEFDCRLSLDFRPRSSVWKTGLVLSNCTGTIDEDYRGEVSAIFYKVASGEIYKIGDRIGQIKIGFTLPMEFRLTENLIETERGVGGYGSTGR
jgi:dUTP pyrophosphatase